MWTIFFRFITNQVRQKKRKIWHFYNFQFFSTQAFKVLILKRRRLVNSKMRFLWFIYAINGFIITWILHQFIIYSKNELANKLQGKFSDVIISTYFLHLLLKWMNIPIVALFDPLNWSSIKLICPLCKCFNKLSKNIT